MKYPFLNLNLKNKKAACSNATFSGGEGGIRTHVSLRTTAFRVQLVTTTSILLLEAYFSLSYYSFSVNFFTFAISSFLIFSKFFHFLCHILLLFNILIRLTLFIKKFIIFYGGYYYGRTKKEH